MKRVLVTGAGGFIGQHLCGVLVAQGFAVRAAMRTPKVFADGIEQFQIPDIGPDTDWRAALRDVDAVIHLAARVHVMHEAASDPVAQYRLANVAATKRLAEQAASAQVKRLLFVSSLKVMGEDTNDRGPFTESDPPSPADPYGISKREAEQELVRVGDKSGLEVVIVRPPMVYGPGVKANFLRLLKWTASGLPLPFASLRNSRSLVGVGNLTDFLSRCIAHPAAAGEAFLISDKEDLSTPTLIRKMAGALGRPSRLLPFPESLLRFGTRMAGLGAEFDRLGGSLQVDCEKATRLLAWQPVCSVDEELRRVADHYLKGAR